MKEKGISEIDLADTVCINCSKLGHISCFSSNEKEVDWSINEAIAEGIHLYIKNYDDWQKFRKQREYATPQIAETNPEENRQDVPENNFMTLMQSWLD